MVAEVSICPPPTFSSKTEDPDSLVFKPIWTLVMRPAMVSVTVMVLTPFRKSVDFFIPPGERPTPCWGEVNTILASFHLPQSSCSDLKVKEKKKKRVLRQV